MVFHHEGHEEHKGGLRWGAQSSSIMGVFTPLISTASGVAWMERSAIQVVPPLLPRITVCGLHPGYGFCALRGEKTTR